MGVVVSADTEVRVREAVAADTVLGSAAVAGVDLAAASAAVVTTPAMNSASQALSCQVLSDWFSCLVDSPVQLVS